MLERLQTVRYAVGGGSCEIIKHAFVYLLSDGACCCVSCDDVKAFFDKEYPKLHSGVKCTHSYDALEAYLRRMNVPGQMMLCSGMYVLEAEAEFSVDALLRL